MEHVVLLEAENQRFLLDSFGGQTHQEALLQTKNAFNLWQEKKRAWQEIQKQEDQQEERQEILQFQQKELEEAQLDVTEEQELQGEYKRLEHAQELAEYAKEAWYLLAGGQLSPLAAVAQSLTCLLYTSRCV